MPDEWFRDSFGETYVEIYAHRDHGEAEAFVRTIFDNYPPPPGGIVFDVACGSGRHVATVARHGYRAIGIDLSPILLKRAAAHLAGIAERSGPPLPPTVPEGDGGGAPRALFALADMRRLPFHTDPGRADMVLNLFTSFGYFTTEAEDARALAGMSGALKPGGLLVLDFMNRERVVETLVAEDERHREGVTIRQRRRLSGGRHLRIEKSIRLEYADGRIEEHEESVRLYSREELECLLRAAGVTPRAWWGDYAAAPYAPDSPRCIAISRRAE